MFKLRTLIVPLTIVALALVACNPAAPTEAPADTTISEQPTSAPTDIPTEVPTELPEEPTPSGPLTLTSTAFEDEGDFPMRHGIQPFVAQMEEFEFRCNGTEEGKENVSPQVSWTNVPVEAESLVLVVQDYLKFAYSDAPEEALFTHWLVYNIPPSTGGFEEGAPADLTLPDGSLQGLNDYPDEFAQGYGGPCPSVREKHMYIFTLYALDTTLDLAEGATCWDEVEPALQDHILAQAELRGIYTGV